MTAQRCLFVPNDAGMYLIDIERYRDIDTFILLTRTWTICLMPYLAQDVPTSTNRHPYIIISPLSRHTRLFHKLWSRHHSSQCLVAGPSATPVMRMVSQVSRHHIWISKSGTGSYQYQLSFIINGNICIFNFCWCWYFVAAEGRKNLDSPLCSQVAQVREPLPQSKRYQKVLYKVGFAQAYWQVHRLACPLPLWLRRTRPPSWSCGGKCLKILWLTADSSGQSAQSCHAVWFMQSDFKTKWLQTFG